MSLTEKSPAMLRLESLLALLSAILSTVEADITMTGCTAAYIRMTCPSDDVIKVSDLQLTEKNSSSPCYQHLPSKDVKVPTDVAHLCEKDFGCEYVEGICDGKQDCLFYISPHLIHQEQKPTDNSEVIIKYSCYPGSRRKAGLGIIMLLVVVGGASLAIIGGLLLRRVWDSESQEPTSFNNMATAPNPGTPGPGSSDDAQVAASASASAAAVASDGDNALRYRTGVEHVSVSLETPSGGESA